MAYAWGDGLFNSQLGNYNFEEKELGHLLGDLDQFDLFFEGYDNHGYLLTDRGRLFKTIDKTNLDGFIMGSVCFDKNNNCECENETSLSSKRVVAESENGKKYYSYNLNDSYGIEVPRGEYSIYTIEEGSWIQCQSTYNTTVNDNNDIIALDIPLQNNGDCAEITMDISTPFLRRCFDNSYYLNIKNKGPQIAENINITVMLDSFFIYKSSNLSPINIEGLNLEYYIPELAIEQSIIIKIVVEVSCDSEIGTLHCINVKGEGDNLCEAETARVNAYEYQENIGSYDPNDLRIFTEEGFEKYKYDKEDYQYYHLRFQNSGTDTAFNIEVVNKMSNKLDLSTLELISTSHNSTMRINDNNSLTFSFKDILLPDSTTNEAASSCYIKYRIKPIESIQYGDLLPSHADIYFDFNDAIQTNIAVAEIAMPTYTKNDTLLPLVVYPNPTQDNIVLKNIPHSAQQFIVYNTSGHIVKHAILQTTQIQIGVQDLNSGLYFIEIIDKDGSRINEKFIKM